MARILISLTSAFLAFSVVGPHVPYHVSRWKRRHNLIREELIDPVAVTSWDPEGLWLGDGRHVQLPDFTELPERSGALSAATKRGVEIAHDGRVYGLIRVWHWCGNDPVGGHVARVDLSYFLDFLQEGEPKSPVEYDKPWWRSEDWLHPQGWWLGAFMAFEDYNQRADAVRREERR